MLLKDYDDAIHDCGVETCPVDFHAETQATTDLKVVGLFAGIGGIEEGFRQAGHKTQLLCEADEVAQQVLMKNFPDVEIHHDVRALARLPACDIVTAGFPCQDLSSVGRRAGIEGQESGLIASVFRLLKTAKKQPSWLLLENVPFMLRLNKGKAIQTIVEQLEEMGWSWAYRIVNTQAFGLPQRRKRLLLLASPVHDPRGPLLGSDAGEISCGKRGQHACGFYWTEGNTGIGWAVDALPPLKGGSGVGIPSPPAIWFPRRRLIATPRIQDAERLQGFSANWTDAAANITQGERLRWKLVGNAVSVPVSKWIATRLKTNQFNYDDSGDFPMENKKAWPDAGWGIGGLRNYSEVSSWPVREEQLHLASFLQKRPKPLSLRATTGFYTRLMASGLKYDSAFAQDLAYHIETIS